MAKAVGCDSHKKYSVFVALNEQGQYEAPVRIENGRRELREYFESLPQGTEVAVAASGGWYWIADLMESSGLQPKLADPRMVKEGRKSRNKTDVLDAQTLARQLRNGTLAEVWMPPKDLRDLRELMRTRLAIRRQSTLLKNRIHAALRRYGVPNDDDDSSLFEGQGRVVLHSLLGWLPRETRKAAEVQWDVVNVLEKQMEVLETRIAERIGKLGWVRLLKTLPGVGEILGATLWLEIGEVKRFASPPRLASYAGLAPTVHASGGKVVLGPTAKASNHYLRWAFVEAANRPSPGGVELVDFDETGRVS